MSIFNKFLLLWAGGILGIVVSSYVAKKEMYKIQEEFYLLQEKLNDCSQQKTIKDLQARLDRCGERIKELIK